MTYQTISTFKQTTDASVTAVKLATNQPCHRITIRNYGSAILYFGDSTVTTDSFPLLSGESITLQISNANKLYYLSSSSSVDIRCLIELEA